MPSALMSGPEPAAHSSSVVDEDEDVPDVDDGEEEEEEEEPEDVEESVDGVTCK